MENEVIQIVKDAWKAKSHSLTEEVNKAVRQMENILTLEDYYRNGHKKEAVAKALGEFGEHYLDAGALSTLFSKGDEKRRMKKERLDRIQKLFNDLDKIRKDYQKNPPQCKITAIDDDAQSILEQSEIYLDSMAEIFRLIRIANMEARAKYQEKLHDEFFSRFNWSHLDDDEIGLCPPFVVWGETQQNTSQYFSKLLTLISEGKPLKIILLQSELQAKKIAEGRAGALQCSANIELLPITFQGIYLLQTASVNSNLSAGLSKGLSSPRPGVFVLFWNGSNDSEFHLRARNALSSRAFPQVVYNPDASRDFVCRLDLSGNPEKEKIWPQAKLEYLSEDGKKEELTRDFTFADFAAQESSFQDQFSPMPKDISEEKTAPLAEFLTLSPSERIRKTPFIYSLDKKNHLIRLVPSQSIIVQTADRMHLWESLQELAGIDNPFVKAVEKKIRDELTTDKDQSIKKLKTEMETLLKTRERESVVSAMRNLALRLTGLEGAKIDLKALATTPISAPLPQAETISPREIGGAAISQAPTLRPAGDQAWVETKLCTTCDECITINKKIFAYNKDKKAIINNPKGGPFKDIVKAAEKCSAKIIHPGKPQDPKEKDLDKWIHRAEKFQ